MTMPETALRGTVLRDLHSCQGEKVVANILNTVTGGHQITCCIYSQAAEEHRERASSAISALIVLTAAACSYCGTYTRGECSLETGSCTSSCVIRWTSGGALRLPLRLEWTRMTLSGCGGEWGQGGCGRSQSAPGPGSGDYMTLVLRGMAGSELSLMRRVV